MSAYVCMDLIIGQKKALLLDSGYGSCSLMSVVRSLTDLPVEIAVTHAHADHMGSISEIRQSILVSEDEYRWITSNPQNLFFQKILRQFKRYPPLQLKDRQSINLGGTILSAIKTPGHTPGSMSFYNTQSKELFVSDSLCPAIMIWEPFTESIQALNQTANRVFSMDIDYFWTGHHLLPVETSKTRVWKKVIKKALIPESFMPVSKTANTFICCDRYWEKELMNKNMQEIYKGFVNRSDFACIFFTNYLYSETNTN